MRSVWILAGLALLLPYAAQAEDCGPLKIIGQADMLSTEGALLVPATVEGHPTQMIIDTGGWYRELAPQLVETLKLSTQRRNLVAIDITVRMTDKTVTVHDFAIGTFKAKDVPFFVPNTGYGNDAIGGLMGPQMLMVMDLDLDFGAKKVNFILQDHCPGKVVYWKTPSYAVVPFTLTDQGHIRMPVELDGHKFVALLDTGAFKSAITLRAADEAFGIGPDSPGVVKTGYLNGDKRAVEYERTFKSLTLAGLTIQNPKLQMVPDLLRNHLINAHRPKINSLIDTNDEAEGVDDVIVGLEELRRLHVYIAYKEQKLYISPLPAPPPVGDGHAVP